MRMKTVTNEQFNSIMLKIGVRRASSSDTGATHISHTWTRNTLRPGYGVGKVVGTSTGNKWMPSGVWEWKFQVANYLYEAYINV